MNLIKSTLTLITLTTALSAQATSPALPPLSKKFQVNCVIDVFVQGATMENLRGYVSMNLKDLRGEPNIAERIKWTRWDMRRQKPVPAELSQLPGRPEVTELRFAAYGDHNMSGKLGSYSLDLELSFTSADNSSKISVATEGNAEANEALNFHSAASQRLRGQKTTYILQGSCTAK